MKKELLARMFVAVHEIPAPVMEGWSVVLHEGQSFARCPDGAVHPLRKGGSLRIGDTEMVYRHEKGEHYLGGSILASQETHWLGYQARPTRSRNVFMIDTPEGRVVRGEVGARVQGMGSLSRCKSGRLMIGGRSLLVAKKTRELSLLVLNESDDLGYLSYFNVLKPGSRSGGNTPAGISGRLVRDERGARFMERGSDDQWHDTARFHEPVGQRISAALRTLDAAEASALVDAQWALLEQESDDLGIPISDLEEHDDLSVARDHLSKTWQRHTFVIAQGKEWIHENLSSRKRREPRVQAPF